MRKSTVCTIVACLLLAAMPYSVAADATEDIPTNAAATGVHDSLVAALTHAVLVATLQGDGPFTVFAPTDQAFADAGIDLSTFDTPEENETLADILLYHVLAGSVNSSAVTDGLSVVMANGDAFTTTLLPTDQADLRTSLTRSSTCDNVISHTIVPEENGSTLSIFSNSTTFTALQNVASPHHTSQTDSQVEMENGEILSQH